MKVTCETLNTGNVLCCQSTSQTQDKPLRYAVLKERKELKIFLQRLVSRSPRPQLQIPS